MINKLKKAIVILAAVPALLFAEGSGNWTGYGDTLTMPRCSSTALVYSDTTYSLTDYNAVRLV